MVKRCLTLSLLILNTALQADSNVRREPSLFLEYEREVTRTIDTAQDEPEVVVDFVMDRLFMHLTKTDVFNSML